MKNEVFWKNPGYKGHPTLKQDISCDYLIVGGGVTGVSLAYFLNKLGAKNIVLIEKDTIASGATGKAAGTIVIKGELDLKDMMHRYGKKKGLRFWDANRSALNSMVSIIKKEKIKCDLDVEDTIYGNATKHLNTAILEEYIVEKEIEPLTELITGSRLKKEFNTPLFQYALLSHKQGISVNPLAFTQNLSTVVKKKGVKVFEYTKLTQIQKNQAITSSGKINFKHIILALDSDLRNSDIMKLASTIIITSPLTKEELKRTHLIPKKIIWDSKDVYHYLKLTKDNRILLGYGDKHVHKKHIKIDPHKPHLDRINSFLHKLVPQLHKKVEYAWSGTFGVTNRKLPIIDQKGNRFEIGGAASQLVSTMISRHLAHKLMGKKSDLEEFFDIK